MASPDDAIDVDVPPSPRIKRGKGDANEPLELLSSDSEDEKPRTPRPAKRAKPAPVTPSPSGNAQLAQLRREREARRGPPPPPQPEVIQDAEGVRGLVVVKNFWGRAQCATALAAIDSGAHAFEGGWRGRDRGRSSMHFGPLVPNFQRKNGEIGAWTTDSRGRQKPGPPPFVRDLIRDAKALGAIPAMASVTDDTACSFVQRYEPGQGGLKPHFDHRWMFQEAILSLSLEGEGLLRMHRGGRVKSVTLARGTLFVMTGDARHKWESVAFARLAGGLRSSSESDDAISSGAAASPLPRTMRDVGAPAASTASTSMAACSVAIL